MDLGALIEPLIAFSSEGIGKVFADIASALYQILYPANAEAAKPVEIPA